MTGSEATGLGETGPMETNLAGTGLTKAGLVTTGLAKTLLVDAGVWKLLLGREWERRDPVMLGERERTVLEQFRLAVVERRVAMIGPVRQTVLSSVGNAADFARAEEMLDPFRDEVVTQADYVKAARLLNMCRIHGVQGGATEMLLCAVAGRRGWEILTVDAGLERCVAVLRDEGLMA